MVGLSQNCWLSNTSENHPVEVFNYGSEVDERCVISAMVGVGASR